MDNTIEKYLPLTEATYYIMVSLVEPKHGYGIMQYTEEISSGKVTLGPGTLYGAINKLLKTGLIIQTQFNDGENSRRKYYILTELGRKVVIAEFERLSQQVENSKESILKLGGVNDGK